MAFRVSYPISVNMLEALSKYPEIRSRLQVSQAGRSDLQLIRVLDNSHYPCCEQLATFIDGCLPAAGSTGTRLLAQSHPFQFEQTLGELFLFAHLRDCLGQRVAVLSQPSNGPGGDLEVTTDELLVEIEVYSPTDLMGYQLFERYVPCVLKYLDIQHGFEVRVETMPVNTLVDQFYYPYSFPPQEVIGAWLADFSEQMATWLSGASPGSQKSIQGPGGQVRVQVRLERWLQGRERLVISSPATKSTDTRLFFEVGTAKDTAQSVWGGKLGSKLFKKQCGDVQKGVLRMLVLNFALADTAFPDFIRWNRFGVRFKETVLHLVGRERPYDVVIPARLGMRCHFGTSVWLNEEIKDAGLHILASAQLYW